MGSLDPSWFLLKRQVSPMRILGKAAGLTTILAMAFTLASCSKSPPPLTEVEGLVLINDEPLPHAQVEFMPESSDFGAQVNSTGVTDDQGRFTLKCNLGQPGAVIGKHHVIVAEMAPPGETRGERNKNAEAQRKLKGRPIPPVYGTYSTTTIILDVKPDQKSYTIKLKS
jgi:hypothetical protein